MQHVARPGSVVVFVNASPQSLRAVDAAAQLAQSVRAPLHLMINAPDDGGHRLTDRAINRIQLRDRMIQVSVDSVATDDLSPFTKACEKARILVAPAAAAADPIVSTVVGAVACPVSWVGEPDATADPSPTADPTGQSSAGSGSAAPTASKRNAASNAASRQAS